MLQLKLTHIQTISHLHVRVEITFHVNKMSDMDRLCALGGAMCRMALGPSSENTEKMRGHPYKKKDNKKKKPPRENNPDRSAPSPDAEQSKNLIYLRSILMTSPSPLRNTDEEYKLYDKIPMNRFQREKIDEFLEARKQKREERKQKREEIKQEPSK